ncbi:MAG TPA: protein rhiA [Reyranella sp.]|jgi:hypothetical protein
MTTQYALTCINNSSMLGSFAVFQRPPGNPGSVFTLAWFTRPTHPGTQLTFGWTTDYCFVWSETGVVKPGVSFSASETLAADPNGQNFTQLTEDSVGATFFTPTTGDGPKGTLTIRQLANVVPDRTSVGIGMSGSGTTVVQAMPNLTATFTPHPNYWVVFGNYIVGQVLDIEQITGEVEVTYPGGLTSRTATLEPNGVITVA